MTPNDMVWNEVYKQCLAAGCDESVARDTEVMTLQKYKNNQFNKVSALIKDAVSQAKKRKTKR